MLLLVLLLQPLIRLIQPLYLVNILWSYHSQPRPAEVIFCELECVFVGKKYEHVVTTFCTVVAGLKTKNEFVRCQVCDLFCSSFYPVMNFRENIIIH